MSNIIEKYEFAGISSDNIYKECANIFSEMGVVSLQEGIDPGNITIRTINGTSPSVWGWGGMQLGVKVYQENSKTLVELNGFIAQLGVSPLSSKMDEFLKRLQEKLKVSYDYNFQYEKLTRFLPKYKLHISKIDMGALLLILLFTFIEIFVNVFGGVSEAVLLGFMLGLGYFLGKKYLFSKKPVK